MNPSEKFNWNKNGSVVLDRNKIYTIGKDKILTTIVKFGRDEVSRMCHCWWDTDKEMVQEVLSRRIDFNGSITKIKRIKNNKDEVVFKVWYN